MWGAASLIFVRDKCITHMWKLLYVGYVHKAEAHTKMPFDSTTRSKQMVRVVQ